MGLAAILGSAGIGSAITAGAGIASSVGSNIANRNMAQMNNQFNERMLQKQIDYNSSMYERQLQDNLKYSDPSFIRQRLSNAGYNPALVGQGSLGTAVSSPASQGINIPRATQYSQDYSGIGQAVQNGLQAYNAIKQTDADVGLKQASHEQLHIENQYRAQKLIQQINESISRERNNKVKAKQVELLNKYVDQEKQLSMSFQSEQIKYMQNQIKESIIEQSIMSQQLKFLPQQQRMEIALGTSQIALRAMQGELTRNQAAHELEKTIKTSVESAGIKLSNKMFMETYNTQIKLLDAQMRRARENVGVENMWQALSKGVRSWF